MYRALYRKWRPQIFTDVAGQQHITSTLRNEVSTGRLSHAYLFTGSRGTGKTTCAKILAKAVNCLNPIDGNPCNECEICRGIDDGSVLDVTEIDAASNNGVDNIRDLREETNFTPSSAKYRVYIIDEVHMLSSGAFNALLKTLEEPPEYVLFVLATTEVHKLPATVLSRCQRFDFRRIPAEDIADRLMFVASEENIELDRDAALLIARISDGALRDALSVLDQCAGANDRISVNTVGEVAGLLGKDYLFSLSDAILNSDSAAALGIIDTLHTSSCDMERLMGELINHFRNIMITKTVTKPENLIVCTPDEMKKLRAAADNFTYATLVSVLEMLCREGESLRYSMNQRAKTESVLVRLCTPSLSEDAGAMLRRISELEKELKRLKAGGISVAPTASARATEPVARSIPVQKSEPEYTEPEPEKPKTEEIIPPIGEVLTAPEQKNDEPIYAEPEEFEPKEAEPKIAVSEEVEPEEDSPLDGQKALFALSDDDEEKPSLPDEPPAGLFDEYAYTEKPAPSVFTPVAAATNSVIAAAADNAPSLAEKSEVGAEENSEEKAEEKPEEIPFAEWPEVIEELAIKCKPLHGALVGSTAFIVGSFADIKAKNNAFEALMTRQDNIDSLTDAIYTVTGTELRPRVYGRKVSKVSFDSVGDSKKTMDGFMNRAKALDLNLIIEE